MKSIQSLLLIAFIAVAAPALASTTIKQTHKLAPDAHLAVDNVAGAVIVHTWDKHQVGISGTLGSNSELKVSGDADDLTIKIKQKNKHSGWFGHSNMGPTTLKLMVPEGISLKADTVSARITAKGLVGGKLDLDTVSGNVQIDADSPHVKINSVSGDLELSGNAKSLDVNTVSGDVKVDKAGADASVQTVSGEVGMHGGPFRDVAVETVSGDIALEGAMADGVSAKLHSMSGDIRMSIAGEPQASLHVSTFSGDIHSPWGKVDEPTHGPGASLDTDIGSGEGRISAKTFSGDVVIRHAD
jgi:DUF4097 and DUF4098 domain-containing protein YvlB